MGNFVVGDVVAVPFPFSNLSGTKLRPAVVLALIEHDNLILCQITAKSFASKRAIKIVAADFPEGNLPLTSYIRPDKVFTAEATIVQKYKGRLKSQALREALTTIQELFVAK